jgi:hypothetical protein
MNDQSIRLLIENFTAALRDFKDEIKTQNMRIEKIENERGMMSDEQANYVTKRKFEHFEKAINTRLDNSDEMSIQILGWIKAISVAVGMLITGFTLYKFFKGG